MRLTTYPIILRQSRRILVRMKGLEPPRLSTLEPKSSAATNYATSALLLKTLKLVAESRSRTWCLELMRLLCKPFHSSASITYLTLSKYSLPIFPASISALAVIGGLALMFTKGLAPLWSSLTLTAVINTLSKWLTTGVTCFVMFSYSGPASRNRTWINSLEGYCSIHWTNAS